MLLPPPKKLRKIFRPPLTKSQPENTPELTDLPRLTDLLRQITLWWRPSCRDKQPCTDWQACWDQQLLKSTALLRLTASLRTTVLPRSCRDWQPCQDQESCWDQARALPRQRALQRLTDLLGLTGRLTVMGIYKFWPEMSYGIISGLFGWNTLWFEFNTVLKCNLRLDDRVFTSEDSSHSDCPFGLDQGYFHGISLLLRRRVNF